MPDRITQFEIRQLTQQIERLGKAVDKICDRLIRLEADLESRTFRKKITHFLFLLYPMIMVVLVGITDSDHRKISEVYTASKPVIEAIAELRL